MASLMTMPDLTWTVRVDSWTWIYKFSSKGAVTWRDPWNGMHGSGRWRIVGGSLHIDWASGSTDDWDVPISTSEATGATKMSDGIHDLRATPVDYYLKPGDVLYSGNTMIHANFTVATIIFDDEVRTGGTVAWICKNPGNIRDGDKFGAYPGKHLQVIGAGAFAIFPDEGAGLMAVVNLLKVYGRVTVQQAMNKYAKKGDGNNDPVAYAATLAKGLGVSVDTYLTTFSDEQYMIMASLITGVETTTKGTAWPIGDPGIPYDLAQRLVPPPP